MVWIDNSAWIAVDEHEAGAGEVVPTRFLQRWKTTPEGKKNNARVIIQAFKHKDVLDGQPHSVSSGSHADLCHGSPPGLEGPQRRCEECIHAGRQHSRVHQDRRQTNGRDASKASKIHGPEAASNLEY